MTEDLALVINAGIFKLCANGNYRAMLSVETNVAHNPEPEAALSREEYQILYKDSKRSTHPRLTKFQISQLHQMIEIFENGIRTVMFSVSSY
ncbi:hypothetical protein B7W85_24845 [Allorhizobium ampelinum]|nr:hypothetical protein B7W85_24845 [Allorhizobium ampelinum]